MTPETLQTWARYILDQPLLCTLFVILLLRINRMHKDNVTQRERHHQETLTGLSKLEHATNSVVAMLMRFDRRERHGGRDYPP